MKTQQEIEKTKDEIQGKIESIGEMERKQNSMKDRIMLDHYNREYAKVVAKYSILLEVLE